VTDAKRKQMAIDLHLITFVPLAWIYQRQYNRI